jgi:hypothetical protein
MPTTASLARRWLDRCFFLARLGTFSDVQKMKQKIRKLKIHERHRS